MKLIIIIIAILLTGCNALSTAVSDPPEGLDLTTVSQEQSESDFLMQSCIAVSWTCFLSSEENITLGGEACEIMGEIRPRTFADVIEYINDVSESFQERNDLIAIFSVATDTICPEFDLI